MIRDRCREPRACPATVRRPVRREPGHQRSHQWPAPEGRRRESVEAAIEAVPQHCVDGAVEARRIVTGPILNPPHPPPPPNRKPPIPSPPPAPTANPAPLRPP